MRAEPLLQIQDLRLELPDGRRLLDGVTLDVAAGQSLGVVGESGSGKSLTAMSVMGLLPRLKAKGSIVFQKHELLSMREKERRKLRGSQMAMIFQDPMTAFLPVRSIGAQIDEQIRLHQPLSRHEARALTVKLLERMGVPDPEMAARRYPHQLSGGLRQRAMIAMALSCSPALLIADEPTTALDVTVQAQILVLLRTLREEGAGVMLITHDMGVVAQSCTHVAVLYAGVVVERGTVVDVLQQPLHPYTQALLAAIPPLDGPKPERLPTIPGQPPVPEARPSGCVFSPRCPKVRPDCAVRPDMIEMGEGRRVACVLYGA
ncbi:ABC transporter ATP-binding protein [Gluconobacter wancherniae]|uniref:ABC transporter ATP-binding protein n=1 Tax=Gluconobacter wancherniae NBRC 103581 TaxID=656744 RepID=A0A511AVQ5_9PROT|nr:ABC transporter ATP-binding protein [Gluconobacter wancherniae]MBF0852487.1 ABC transporter ATP-binding protein [Gluconobacter wancherniae]GBD56803.1 ABC transporter ATP-binding protein [Gluconobacter wancherniae NBRC 103581]GBR64576.1 peptide ABC transporter ATP-binding protein [Gluconobacter wancherniae NBRC 103581]GEK92289.1 ABC transporter ATP-binding protein [Gluconobacter wancherniae NBRC 103581]